MQQIVIIGGGAGGLELATKLGQQLGKKNKACISLIDANRTHIWKPKLHEVAAGVLNTSVDELSYAAHAQQNGFKFIWGRLAGLDRTQKYIKIAPKIHDGEQVMAAREVNYDRLIVAVGSQTNDFGTRGASEHCIFLDQRQAAEKFHQQFLNVYLRASEQAQEEFNIAIIGAGATGVELAAELKHAAKQLLAYGFDAIQPDKVNIRLIEASDRVLPALSPKASAAIKNQLEKLGIQVMLNEMVTEIDSANIHTKSGKLIPAQLKVWSAGVKAPACLQDMNGLEINRLNQLVVDNFLQTKDTDIFAFGDCAQCMQTEQDKPVPPRAQAAHQQAQWLGKHLLAQFNNKPSKAFIYQDKGSLISLSKGNTVGNLMGNLSKDFTFEGKMARLFYVALYRLHQLALHGFSKTALLWLRDRLNKRTGPKLKLH